jgi:penicillin amidase
MQVGHVHSSDYYIENPSAAILQRIETIKVAGGEDVLIPVYHTSHGPVINPMPFDPGSYVPSPANPVIAWKYAHRGYEFETISGLLDMARATSMDEFGDAIESVAVSQHFCYADVDGNIAYWMSGRDPVRPPGEYRLPQGLLPAVPTAEWDSSVLIPRSTDRNTDQGFYCGWNNKSSAGYPNSANCTSYFFGPFHRAHVIHEYLDSHDSLTFEEIRDLALNIAATDSIRHGGNPWIFVEEYFTAAVADNGTDERDAAVDLLDGWDGHFVDGGAGMWASDPDRADAWMLTDAWIREAVRLAFEDELGQATYETQNVTVLFNVFLHGLGGMNSGIVNIYDWFQNLDNAGAPQTSDEIILLALDNTLAALGDRPWGTGQRGEIDYNHDMLGLVHTTPFSSRSTYAHCVEMGQNGPVRIESMFPLGESGNILMNTDGSPAFDANFFSMTGVFDLFEPRDFPISE